MGKDISGNVACGGGKQYHIEVTGVKHAHGKEQSFVFYDLTDAEEQSTLEKPTSCSTNTTDASNPTTVYSWDWKDQAANRNVWLEIKTTGGDKIKLPLFADVAPYKLRKNDQDYKLQAIVPMTLLPTFNSQMKEEDLVAPVRDGYLYIAYKGKIWREIQISTTDIGEPCFNDVALANYRSASDEQCFLEKTARDVSGVDLNEIWFPVKDDGSSTDVRLAYSEVQWSGARLNRLEKHLDELTERMISVPSSLLVVNNMAKMRARNFELEMLLGTPVDYNRDILGTWLSDTYSSIKNAVQEARSDGNEAVRQFQLNSSNDYYRYELTLKQTAFQEILISEENSKDESDEELYTSDQGQIVDWLGYAKQHSLRALVFDDPLFNVRNKSYLCKAGVSYLGFVLRDISQQTYFNAAELVQRFFVPKKWGDKENKNHKYVKDHDFDNYFGGRFHRTLRSTERWWCSSVVNEVQSSLMQLIESNTLASHLKDIASLDDANAAAIYPFIGNAISSIKIQIDQLDSFALSEKQVETNKNLDSLQKLLSNDRSHPLHSLLFVEEGKESLDVDYIVPDSINDGSGVCTPESIARWSDKNLLIDPQQIKVLELNEIRPALEDNGEGKFCTVRRISGALDGLLKGFFEATNEVTEALRKTKTTGFNFNAYVPALGLLKSIGPTAMGRMRFAVADQLAASTNWYVIGVHGQGLTYGLSDADREYATNKRGTSTIRAYDQEGKLAISSNKKAVTSAGEIADIKAPIRVVAVPESEDIAKLYNKPNTRQALKDLGKDGVTWSGAYEKFKVPYFIVLVELWNLKNNWQYFTNILDPNGKDKIYSSANFISAVTDLSVALVHTGNYCLGAQSQLSKLTTKAITFRPITKMALKSLKLSTTISRLAFVGAAAGLLTAGIAAYDTVNLVSHNDTDAAIGMGMVAVGAFIGAWSSIAAAGTLGSTLGPLGIVLGIAGGLLYMWLKDTPIEVWISNGPFSKDPSDDYAHLQDADIAFKRLLSLLIAFDARAYSVSDEVILSADAKALLLDTDATHIVLVHSNLAQLLNQDKVELSLFARQGILEYQRIRSRSPDFAYEQNVINMDSSNIQSISHKETNNGDLYLFKFEKKVPDDKSETNWIFMRFYEYHYEPAFIIRARLLVDDIVMPSPPLDDAMEPNYQLNQIPSFNEQDKFWIKSIATPKYEWSLKIYE